MTNLAQPMRVAIRANASIEIGTGHVMRCLSLAVGLADNGAQVRFLCRVHDGNLIDSIERRSFKTIPLPVVVTTNLDLSVAQTAHAHWLGCDWRTDVNQSCASIADTVDWSTVDHYAYRLSLENSHA